MADLGLNSAASFINDISPTIARRLLDSEYNPEQDYDDKRFLSSPGKVGSSALNRGEAHL